MIREALAEAAPELDGVPGVASWIQTFGSFVRCFNPHLHLVVAEGLFTAAGGFHPVADWLDAARLEERFRRRVLSALVDAERLSPKGHERFLAWAHSGFSAYGRQVLSPDAGADRATVALRHPCAVAYLYQSPRGIHTSRRARRATGTGSARTAGRWRRTSTPGWAMR